MYDQSTYTTRINKIIKLSIITFTCFCSFGNCFDLSKKFLLGTRLWLLICFGENLGEKLTIHLRIGPGFFVTCDSHVVSLMKTHLAFKVLVNTIGHVGMTSYR